MYFEVLRVKFILVLNENSNIGNEGLQNLLYYCKY